MISMQGSEGPSDAIPHVTDELREAVQAATTTRRIQGVIPTYACFCDDSTTRPIDGQIME